MVGPRGNAQRSRRHLHQVVVPQINQPAHHRASWLITEGPAALSASRMEQIARLIHRAVPGPLQNGAHARGRRTLQVSRRAASPAPARQIKAEVALRTLAPESEVAEVRDPPTQFSPLLTRAAQGAGDPTKVARARMSSTRCAAMGKIHLLAIRVHATISCSEAALLVPALPERADRM